MASQSQGDVRRRVKDKDANGISDTTKPLSANSSKLLHWDDLPAWRRDNAYIRSGYRPTSNSYARSFQSIAAVHNESVNIWTHLGGAVLAMALALGLYFQGHTLKDVLLGRSPVWSSLRSMDASSFVASLRSIKSSIFAHDDRSGSGFEPDSSSPDSLRSSGSSSSTLVHFCFAAGAFACLGMSATYHALTNHSPAVARWGNKLDYTGIVLLIVGSYMPALYYGLYCHPWWLTFYMYLINLLGLSCIAVSWLEHFRTPQWRPYRALLFIGLGASGVVPICHALLFLENQGLDGAGNTLAARYAHLNERMGLNWILVQGGLYVFGATLYACRFPERLSPGRFDIWGSSHQIFHIFVLLAAAAHLRAVMLAYTYHSTVPGGGCRVPPL